MSEDERLRDESAEPDAAETDEADEADVEAHGKGGSPGGGGFTIGPVPPDTA